MKKQDIDPGFRLTRRGKVVGVLAGLVMATTVVLAVNNNIESSQPKIDGTKVYTVQENDTMWDIAEKNNPGGELDIRMVMDEIEKLNHLEENEDYLKSGLKTGQKILLPKYN